jgi:hypothetical protein
VPPKKTQEILDERMKREVAASNSTSPVFVALSSSSEPRNDTVNTPAPATLSIVSWNVQTFEASKSLKNPFVNIVINKVLEVLDVDICLLLETRDESYVNMNMIEGPLDSGDESMGVEPDGDMELVQSQDDYLESLDGGENLVYQQLVSEMTGKKWRPPYNIHVFDREFKEANTTLMNAHRFRTLRKKYNDKKNLTARESKDYHNLSGSFQHLTSLFDSPDSFLHEVNKGLDKKFHCLSKEFASKFNYSQKMLVALCENGKAPTLTWLEKIYNEEQRQIVDYYDLYVLDDSLKAKKVILAGFNPSAKDNWRYLLKLKKCEACETYFGTGEPPYSCASCSGSYDGTHLQNLRECIAEVTWYRCNHEEAYSVLVRPSTQVHGPSTNGVWLTGKAVTVFSIGASLMTHVPSDGSKQSADNLLGYTDPNSRFYGRAPYRVNLSLTLMDNEAVTMPLIGFHAPYGKSTIDGIKARVSSLESILDGASTIGKMKILDCPVGILIGDFNLDYTPVGKCDSSQTLANQLYNLFWQKAWVPQIEGGVNTSLKTIRSPNIFTGQLNRTTEEFTSSAYDNCFVKGLNNQSAGYAIDVISWIEDNLGNLPALPDDDKKAYVFHSATPKEQAFYIYRQYVSDHLPIIVDITVQEMKEDSERSMDVAKQNDEMNAVDNFPGDYLQEVHIEKIITLSVIPDALHSFGKINHVNSMREIIASVIEHHNGHIILCCQTDFNRGALIFKVPKTFNITSQDFCIQYPLHSKVRAVYIEKNFKRKANCM